MLVRALGFSAALALAANAILLPPTVAVESISSDDRDNVLNTVVNPDHVAVAVKCAGCPYAQEEGKEMVWTEGVENSLVYNFQISADRSALGLNGVQLYPPKFGIPDPIYIQQVPNDEDLSTFAEEHPDRRGLRIAGLEFKAKQAETMDPSGNELLIMTVKVMAIADQAITPQALNVFLIKAVDGTLMIASVKEESAEELEAEEAAECASWPALCKWRQYLSSKLSAMRNKFGSKKPGCHKHKSRPQESADRVDNRPHHRPLSHGKPPKGQNRHHGHHRHHNKIHRILHLVAHLLVTIIVPIFIGVAAGVATYMAGMIIGMTAALIWAKVSGRGQYRRIALDEEAVDDDDDEDDAPMKSEKEIEAYSDAPVEVEAPPCYEEAAEATEKEVVN